MSAWPYDTGAIRPQRGQAVLPTQPLTFFGTLAKVLELKAVIELMRPNGQRTSEIEGVAAPSGVRVLFIAQSRCSVRVAQYPGANRAHDPGMSFGILVEEVRNVAMLLGVVEVQHLVGVLQNFGELARRNSSRRRQRRVP